MAKTDTSQDHYAILECKPDADTEDIRKAYRKLGTVSIWLLNSIKHSNGLSTALKWHPDRNRGNEAEASSKFQAISAAHEVLTEPELRVKYDANRYRAARAFASYTSPTSSGPGGMPQRDPNNIFSQRPAQAAPTQPRRPNPFSPTSPRAPSKGASMKSPSSGAARYTPYTNHNGWSKLNKEDPQTRANTAAAGDAFRTWNQMKPGVSNNPNAASSNAPRGRSTRSNTFTAQNVKDGQHETPKARPGWDTYTERKAPPTGMSRSNTTRVPRKTGFDPGTPGGDEPAATSRSAYFNVFKGERPHAMRPQAYPPPPPGPPPTSRKPEPLRPGPTQDFKSPDPLRSFRSPQSDDPYSSRLRTPYATSGGEKTFFSSDGLYRTASTGSNLHAGWQNPNSAQSDSKSPTAAERHRSASPRMRSPNLQYSSPSSSTSSDEDDLDLDARVKLKPKGYRTARNNNADGAHARRPPQPSVTIEDEDGTTTEFGKPKQRSTWSAEEGSGAQTQSKQFVADQAGPRRTSTSDIPEGVQHRAKHDSERMPHSPLRTEAPWSNDDMGEPLEKSPTWQEKFGYGKDGANHRHFDRPSTGGSKDNRPMYDPLFSSCMPASFIRCKTPYWAIPSSLMPRKQSEVNDVTRYPNSNKVALSISNSTDQMRLSRFHFPNESSESSSSVRSQAAEKTSPFSQAKWEKTFNGESGDYLAPQSNGSMSRGRSSPSKGRPATIHVFSKSPPKDTPLNTTSQTSPPVGPVPAPQPLPAKFSQEQWDEHFKEPSWAYPQTVTSPRGGSSKWSRTPRKMSTTSKRPIGPKPVNDPTKANITSKPSLSSRVSSAAESSDTLSSQGSAMDIDPKNTPPIPTHPPLNHDPITNIIRSAVPGSRSGSKAGSVKSSQSDIDSDLNLDDLKNAAPFVPNDSGLADLGDLHATLPFESAPSTTGPGTTPGPRRLALPPPPKAPHAPNPNKLTKKDFDYYMLIVKNYLVEWYAYNKKMMAHFSARQHKNETELPENWLESRGNEGYAKYMAGVEEDFLVREHWDLSWEKHKAAMETLGELRKVAKKGEFMG